jgi:hypothetical protein
MLTGTTPPEKLPPGIEFERHFSAEEIANIWNVSVDTTRDIFRDVPGVLVIGSDETIKKRAYRTLRIPESVCRATHKKLRNAA